MSRRAFTLIEAIVVVCIVSILAAILWPVFQRTHCNARRESCQSNLKQIGFGFKQYVQDYDGRLPRVDSAGGWANSLQPYLKTALIFQCPSEVNDPAKGNKPWRRGYTDYFLNAHAAGEPLEAFTVPHLTVLMADGNDGNDFTTASYHYAQPPARWRDYDSSPLYRHYDGADYAFVDGHVKWLRARNAPGRWGASEQEFTFEPFLAFGPYR